MIPNDFSNFFVASTGAGAALVGLLFVAISIAPRETVSAQASLERQAVASSAFTAMVNAFIISLTGLIPGANLGTMALLMGIVSSYSSLTLAWDLLKHWDGWQVLVRRMVLIVLSLAIYVLEIVNGVALLNDPHTTTYVYTIVGLLVGVYGTGLVRAWQLLGGQRRGVLSSLTAMHTELPPSAAVPLPIATTATSSPVLTSQNGQNKPAQATLDPATPSSDVGKID